MEIKGSKKIQKLRKIVEESRNSANENSSNDKYVPQRPQEPRQENHYTRKRHKALKPKNPTRNKPPEYDKATTDRVEFSLKQGAYNPYNIRKAFLPYGGSKRKNRKGATKKHR